METVGQPKTQHIIGRIYDFYNKREEIVNVHFENEDHDYGIGKRKAVYKFLCQKLKYRNKLIKIDFSGVVFVYFGYHEGEFFFVGL